MTPSTRLRARKLRRDRAVGESAAGKCGNHDQDRQEGAACRRHAVEIVGSRQHVGRRIRGERHALAAEHLAGGGTVLEQRIALLGGEQLEAAGDGADHVVVEVLRRLRLGLHLIGKAGANRRADIDRARNDPDQQEGDGRKHGPDGDEGAVVTRPGMKIGKLAAGKRVGAPAANKIAHHADHGDDEQKKGNTH
jgi:hypothetical protein